MSGGGQAGLDLELCAPAGRERPLRRHPPARDEEGPRVPGLCAWRDDAALDRPQPCDPVELTTDALERLQPVAQPRRIFVTARVRKLGQLTSHTRERERGPV